MFGLGDTKLGLSLHGIGNEVWLGVGRCATGEGLRGIGQNSRLGTRVWSIIIERPNVGLSKDA